MAKREEGSQSKKGDTTPWERIIGLSVVGSIVVALIFLAFSWPSITAKPKDVPLAIAGPAQQAEIIQQHLDDVENNPFDVHFVEDRDEAVQEIKQREAFGALVLGAQPEVLIASANGAVATQAMSVLATQLQAMIPVQVNVADIVPLTEDDPRGIGLTTMALPLVIGGMIGGVLVSLTVTGVWRRLIAITAFALFSGLFLTLVMQTWLNLLPGDFLDVAVAIGLTVLAIGSVIVGLHLLWGRAGIAIGAILAILVGNPLSGITQPKEFFVEPWGTVGQYFAPGAGGTLIKNSSYFPEASVALPLIVLLGWVAVGFVLSLIGHRRND